MGLILAALGCCFLRTRRLWNDDPVQLASAASPTGLAASLSRPAIWANVALFLVYTGVEAMAGQWAYSLFTEGRGMAPALAGMAVSGYWGSLTLGRVASGAASRIPAARLLRGALVLAPAWAFLIVAARGPATDVMAL